MWKPKQTGLMLVGLVFVVAGYWQFWRWVEPGFFLNDDNGNFFLGAYAHNYRALVDGGELAFINYGQHLGTRHLGQGQTGVLYPLVYVSFWLAEVFMGNRLGGVDVLVFLHWVLGVVGMWWWLRSEGVRGWLAVLGAGWYLSFPFVAGVSRSWVVVAYLFAYLPFGFLSIKWVGKSRSRWAALVAVLVRWLLVLQGYIQWVVVMGLVELVYVALEAKKRKEIKTEVIRLVGIWGLVAMLGAPVLLPLWRSAGLSTARSKGLVWEELVENRVTLREGLMAQWGDFVDGQVFEGSSYIFFVGPGLLWLVGWWWLGRGHKESWVWVKRLGLVLGVGLMTTWVYGWVTVVPVLNQFRWPMKYLVVFEFLLVWVVVGWGKALVKKQKWLVVGMGACVALNVAVMWQNRSKEMAFSEYVVELPVEQEWQGLIKNDGRVFSYGVDPMDWRANTELLGFNLPSVVEVVGFGGYDAAPPEKVLERVGYMPAWGAGANQYSVQQMQYLRDWGVKYWLGRPGDEEEMEKLELEMEYGDEKRVLWVDKQAALLVYGLNSDEEVEYEFGVNYVDIWPEGVDQVVVNVNYWPEYRVMKGDGEVREWKGRVLVSGVGDDLTVRLRFVDRDFLVGLVVVVLGLGVGGWWWSRSVWDGD